MAIGSPQWMYASGDFTLDQSLRFNDGDSAYLSFTAGTPTSARIGTFSVWVKPCGLTGADQSLFGSYTTSSNRAYIRLHTDGNINMYDPHSSSGSINIKTTAVYRDPSAWMHILIAIDATQGTASNRLKIYVNGVQVTDFASEVYPDNVDQTLFKDGNTYAIGASQDSGFGRYLDGYLAEYHFIDGTALTPSSFGETGDYGEWKPKQVSGLTYGTNGYYLSFAGGGIMSATGGTITTDGDFKVNSFTSDGTFTPSADGYVEYLVVAGGGGAGGASGKYGSGGGAGGMRTGTLPVTADTAYSITVGNGGAAQAKGLNSIFSTITSTGGGRGPTSWAHGSVYSTDLDGGSGGGTGTYENQAGGSGIAGQGNDGGTGSTGAGAGGGGGAGAVGGAAGATSGAGGAGGAGLASSITGSSVTYAGGGGGSGWDAISSHNGGAGGGGRSYGHNQTQGSDSNGTANTGGGGGGGSNKAGGAGGSGIVIIRYKFQ